MLKTCRHNNFSTYFLLSTSLGYRIMADWWLYSQNVLRKYYAAFWKNMPEENEENETNGVVYCNGIHNAKPGSTEATHPLNVLKQKAVSWNVSLTDDEFVKRMDAEDPMSRFREMFCYPIKRHLPDGEWIKCIYISLWILYECNRDLERNLISMKKT